MGAWITVAPAAWASSTSFFAFSSICVESMTSWTAPCNAPPSDVKSFWNSISTTAVDFGSVAMWAPLDREAQDKPRAELRRVDRPEAPEDAELVALRVCHDR